jgi:hypothetical protein
MAAILFLPFESRTQKVSEKLTIQKPDIWLSDAYCISGNKILGIQIPTV